MDDIIGIGTTTPGERVEINGNLLFSRGGSRRIFVDDNSSAAGNDLYIVAGRGYTGGDFDGGDILIKGGNGAGAGEDGNVILAERGFVGIGETSPQVPLHIVGSARLNTMSSAPTTPAPGEIYSDGTDLFYYSGSSWEDLTAGTGGDAQWSRDGTGGFIYANENDSARVYDLSDTAYFYANSVSGNGGLFITSYTGTPSYAGLYGVASSVGDADNWGLYGKNVGTGTYGYVGGQFYGVFGKYPGEGSGNYGVLGAPDTGVIGYAYHTTDTIYGGYFEAENASGNTNTVYGLYSKGIGNAGKKYGLYAQAIGDGTGNAYGVYAEALSADTAIAVYGESDQAPGVAFPFTMDWDWIAGASTDGDTVPGGWISTDTDAIIGDNGSAAIYGINVSSVNNAVGVTGRCDDDYGIGLFGYAGRFGVIGVSTNASTGDNNRAGGFFHCNNWGSRRRPSGTGILVSGGNAGTITFSHNIGLYSATSAGSEGAAAYLSGNSYVTNGLDVTLVEPRGGGEEKRVPTYSQVNLDAKVQIEGTAQIIEGEGFVTFPKGFSEVADPAARPVITLTPYSADCNQLAVTEITEDGFRVRETGGGAHSVEFAWIAIAPRWDYKSGETVPADMLERDFDRDFTADLPIFRPFWQHCRS